MRNGTWWVGMASFTASACGGGAPASAPSPGAGGSASRSAAGNAGGTGASSQATPDQRLPDFAAGPSAGNPDGHCEVPVEARAADTSNPDRVVGTGSAASCSSAAFVAAVAQGGTITFDCGPDPVVITLDAPAKIRNDASDDVIIDGHCSPAMDVAA